MGMLAYNTKHRLNAHQVHQSSCCAYPASACTCQCGRVCSACKCTRWARAELTRGRGHLGSGDWPLQVLKHDWVATQGGAAPRLLSDGVAHGAANVAALRRLRNLAHGDLIPKPLIPHPCA